MTNQTYDDIELQRSLEQSVQRLYQDARQTSLFLEEDTEDSPTFSDMEDKVRHLEAKLADAESKLQETMQKFNALEANRDEYKSKYFQFKGIFQRQTQTFYLYQNLSAPTKEALSGVFKGTSFEAFLACGVQPGNIDAVWEFSRTAALEGNLADLDILQTIIAYFVKLYNNTHDSPILAFQKTAPGDRFDVDLHIRTQDSRAAGKISRVLLAGLVNAFSGEVIKKAVVEIK